MQSAKMAAAQLRPLSSTGLVSVLCPGLCMILLLFFFYRKQNFGAKCRSNYCFLTIHLSIVGT